MNRILYLVAVSITIIDVSSPRNLPEFLKLCKRSDPKLQQCIRDTIESLRPHMAEGIPQMGIKSMNPIQIKKLSLAYGQGTNSEFVTTLNDMKFFGAADFKLTDVDFSDLQSDKRDNISMKIDLSFPTMYLDSQYVSDGKLLVLTFHSEGQFTANFTDIDTKGLWTGKIVDKNGKDFIVITDTQLDVHIRKMHIYFHDLFPGNDALGDQMNSIANENTDVIYDELRPIIQQTIKSVIAKSIESVYKYYSMDVLFPK